MKTLLLSAATFICCGLHSQPKFPGKKDNGIQPALNLVVQDYFQNFHESMGAQISESADAQTFESRVKIPGALSCIVTKYPLPSTFSWEAIMCSDEDFDVASKRYAQLFKELNNAKFTPNGFEKFVLRGVYDAPDESRGFSGSVLKLGAPRKPWDNFTIALGIEYEFPAWIVKISMYEKTPDEDIRPGMKTLRE